MSAFPRFWTAVVDIFFPPRCVACAATISPDVILCAPCAESITVATAFFCSVCKRRIPTLRGRVKKCTCKNSYIAGAAAQFSNPVIRAVIHRLKYREYRAPATFCGELLHRFITQAGLNVKNFMVIPLPLGAARKRMRGFNQAELIAKNFCDAASIPGTRYFPQTLVRARNTPEQTSAKSVEERRRNIRGCFALHATAPNLQGKNIILIDDVFTSGATSTEAASVLRAAHARTIIILAVARS